MFDLDFLKVFEFELGEVVTSRAERQRMDVWVKCFGEVGHTSVL